MSYDRLDALVRRLSPRRSACLFALLLGCSGPTESTVDAEPAPSSPAKPHALPGQVSLSGVLDGRPLAFTDASSVVGHVRSDRRGPNFDTLQVTISEVGACGELAGPQWRADGRVLRIASPFSGGVGTYPASTVTFVAYGSTCVPGRVAEPAPGERVAKTGSATITRFDDTTVAGSLDVTFADGSHVTGTFEAPSCSAGALAPLACP